MPGRYTPIEDHGVVGDLSTVALVSLAGSIDFLCFPRFDSPTVFAALLDPERGGFFSIAPSAAAGRRRQMYFPDTNVLLTRFLSDEGVAELTDFMPVEDDAQRLVRRVKVVRGAFRVHVQCRPRFDYARSTHEVEQAGGSVVFSSRGTDRTRLRLRASRPVAVRDGDAVAELCLRAGESASFVLEDAGAESDGSSGHPHYVADAFKETQNYWRQWIGRSTYRGRWRDMVNRSALVLKLLTSRTHGALVAAPTFGLPETVGAERNWDYRYTWIRDASLSVRALLRLGLQEEARSFLGWIERRCEDSAPDGRLQIVYGIDGRRDLTERTVDSLDGYQGSRPVRIGNAAHDQLQLDIYGELLDAIERSDRWGEPVHHDLWAHVSRMLDWVAGHWQMADKSIWEIRAERRHFLFSRLMSWVALDRGLRIARRRSLPCDVAGWTRSRDAIYEDVFGTFWHAEQGAFVQAAGLDALDASTLAMPLMGMISPTDPRWLSTLRRIREDLVEDSLLYRYANEDGLHGPRGTFSICSFWLVECLSRAGDLQQARFVLEKMLGLSNHLGLYGEGLGTCAEHLGNFPQAFTHLALINAACDLDARLDAAGS